MLGKLVLEQQGVTSLAHHRASRMHEGGSTRRLLPGNHTPAVDEGSEQVAVVARALSMNGSSLLAVLVHRPGNSSGFSLAPI